MGLPANQEQIKALGDLLIDRQQPLHERFRALFTLRNLPCPESVDAIAACFDDDSVLLKHELAYCLGQMNLPYAVPVLKKILSDVSENPIVRHEAAEALGAIGTPELEDFLRKFLEDDSIVVVQTCQIAVDRICHQNQKRDEKNLLPNPYNSVDPAPPCANDTEEVLLEKLMDTKLSLFERYRAMFALRNKGGAKAVLALTKGFADSSALFRHEIGYVLGQMSHEASVPALAEVLKNNEEHEMVRHEAAEALGSIADEMCLPVLEEYKKDPRRIVRESCIVALDMYEYENSHQFQYADGLSKLDKKY